MKKAYRVIRSPLSLFSGGQPFSADGAAPAGGTEPSVLAFDGVSLRYSGGFGLDDLSLELAPRRTTALVGPSGCGKSTVLRLAAGLLWPDSGTITVRGRAMTPASADALRRRLGFVLQEGGLFPHMTASRNITLMASYAGWDSGRIDARLKELLELTHLTPAHLARYPHQLSGGERQRVSLARALMLDPDLLLLDEPLGALDPIVRHNMQGELRQLFQSLGKTVLLVTHDLAEAGYLAEHLILMRGGAVVQAGSLRSLVETPASKFVARFVSAQRQIAEVLEGET
jgi:osmoprotectant transport system ATP-binding protein